MELDVEKYPNCRNCKHFNKMFYFNGSSLKNINYLCDMRYEFIRDCKFREVDDNDKQSNESLKKILLEMKETLSNIESILRFEEQNKTAPN